VCHLAASQTGQAREFCMCFLAVRQGEGQTNEHELERVSALARRRRCLMGSFSNTRFVHEAAPAPTSTTHRGRRRPGATIGAAATFVSSARFHSAPACVCLLVAKELAVVEVRRRRRPRWTRASEKLRKSDRANRTGACMVKRIRKHHHHHATRRRRHEKRCSRQARSSLFRRRTTINTLSTVHFRLFTF
jgi:hypothetical protein